MKRKRLTLELFILLTGAAILLFTLDVKPFIGLADSGDFSRIMDSVGLFHLPTNTMDRYFGYFNRQYAVVSVIGFPTAAYISSQLIIVKIAVLLDFLLSWDSVFDVRILGILYSLVYLTAFYMLIRHNQPKTVLSKWFCFVLTLLIFMDVGYTAFFNSLYGEAVSLTFLCLTLGLAFYIARQSCPTRRLLKLFIASSLVFISAKAQNSPLGILIALFCLRLQYLDPGKQWRHSVIKSAILLMVFSLSLYAFSVPRDIRVCNKYQTVFFGILRNSPTPEQDLRELGLRQDLAILSGTNFFMKGLPVDIRSPDFLAEINRKVDHKKVLAFYLKHPVRLLSKLQIATKEGFKIRPGYLGNYEKDAGIGYQGKTNAFALWSTFKNDFLPHNLAFVGLFFGTYFMVILQRYRKAQSLSGQLSLDIFMLIGLIGLCQLVIPIISDGEADLSKHLFLFNVRFDGMLMISVLWIIDVAVLRIKRKHRKHRDGSAAS